MKIILVSIVFFLSYCLFSQKYEKISLLFVGDVMQHDGQIAAAFNKNANLHDYKDCFKFVKPIVQDATISIANLEVTHPGKPYKGYPQFSAPPQLTIALVDAGFNVILTANNHSCDGKSKGIIGTLNLLDSLKVKHTGTFRNQKERDENYPLLIEENGFRVALLNYTYGTNGLTVPAPLIVNYIDSTQMKADFEKAKSSHPDLIICTMHWGDEYKPEPNKYQKNWEKFCYDNGADMVIGSHPHVLQAIEKKKVDMKDKLTVWSLGNFISNQRDRYKDGGVILRTDVVKKPNGLALENTNYILTWVYPKQEFSTKPYYILPDFNYNFYQNNFLSHENENKRNLFYEDSRKLYANHNKGDVFEIKIESNDAWKEVYKLHLKGYFSVLIEENKTPKFKTVLHEDLKKEMHQFTSKAGSYLMLMGMFESKDEARRVP
jgi:hypothetical protein